MKEISFDCNNCEKTTDVLPEPFIESIIAFVEDGIICSCNLYNECCEKEEAEND